MNFIAHYYFEERSDNPYYNLGLVLPDFVRIFLRNKHIFPSRIDNAHLTESGVMLNEGSKTHMEQDKVFHNCTYFHHMMEFSKVRFKRNKVADVIPKSWFLAHIALELILDRHLINSFPHLVDEFYEKIGQCQWSEIEKFLTVHQVENISKFKEKFEVFMSVKYVYEYTKDDRLTFALNKVYQRAGMESEWNTEQKDALISCFYEIEEETKNQMENLKKELSLQR